MIFKIEDKNKAILYKNTLKRTKVFLCGDRDIKKINNLKLKNHMIFANNILEIEEKPKEFKKIATAFLFNQSMSDFEIIEKNFNKIFNSTKLEKDCVKVIRNYIDTNLPYRNELANEIFEKALENNDFDLTYWAEFLEFKSIVNNLNFLKFLNIPTYQLIDKDLTNFINRNLLINKKNSPEFFNNFEINYVPLIEEIKLEKEELMLEPV